MQRPKPQRLRTDALARVVVSQDPETFPRLDYAKRAVESICEAIARELEEGKAIHLAGVGVISVVDGSPARRVLQGRVVPQERDRRRLRIRTSSLLRARLNPGRTVKRRKGAAHE